MNTHFIAPQFQAIVASGIKLLPMGDLNKVKTMKNPRTKTGLKEDDYTRSALKNDARTNFQEELNKENKQAKDKKKEVNDLKKNNKEMAQEIAKMTTDASDRMEQQLEKMGQIITKSNNEVQSSISKLADTIQAILTPAAMITAPAVEQKSILKPCEKTHKISQSMETQKEDQSENY